jgi:5-methylcytosine-specific restriction endonuclease McrA
MVCSACGQERPDRGKCSACGSLLCSTCRAPLPTARKCRRCPQCDREYRNSRLSVPRLCSTCAGPLPAGKKSHRCAGCDIRYASHWRATNPEKDRERSRRWAQANPEKQKDYSRKWAQANPERVKEAGRKWRASNPDKGRQKKTRRRARKKGCEVSATDLNLVLERSQGNCAMCRSHIPVGFRHLDHIIPLAKGGPHTQENLQLLCYRCNTRKGAKLPDEVKPETWRRKPLPDQPFLLNPNWG